MNMLNLNFLFLFWSWTGFFSGVEKSTPEAEKPQIIKLGTIDCDLVETSPIVFHGKVYRFEYVRPGYWNNHTGDSYFRFMDHETGKTTSSFAKGFHLGSAFVDNNTVYVTAVNIWDGEQIHIFSSTDLKTGITGWLLNCPVTEFSIHR